MRIEEMIAAVQRELGVEVDGKAGPDTWGAIYARLVAGKAGTAAPAPIAIPAVDPRSEKVISTLLPEVQPFARALVQKAANAGITIKVISGLRSFSQQDALYARGRTAPGNKVTNAQGGYSNHNFAIAFDIGVYESGKYVGDSPKYAAVGILGKELGLEWGGSWKSFVDQAHFQLRPAWARDLPDRQMFAELRARNDAGRPLYA